jgi:hypothetical protein
LSRVLSVGLVRSAIFFECLLYGYGFVGFVKQMEKMEKSATQLQALCVKK